MADVLCVDDDATSAGSVAAMLREQGHNVRIVTTVEAAASVLGRHPFDAVIAALPLTGREGGDPLDVREALDQLRGAAGAAPLIVTAAHPDPQQGVEALDHGALDYLTRPVRREALRLAVTHALEVGRLRREHELMRRSVEGQAPARAIVGHSEPVRKVLATIAAVAPTRAAVLLEGESGTGKELFARAVHELSPRRERPFVSVNCAALPEGLVESTLFGYERGAFTGAAVRTPGAFERAHLGTLLLDEISEMRLDLQAKLLRAVQEQEFERVGGVEPVRVDVRVITTTNLHLCAEVEAGRFRRDLYFRISVVPIRVPALRERLDDMPMLVNHFVRRGSEQLGIPIPDVPPEVIAELVRRTWPGNIRELENVIERALILARGRPLTRELVEPASGPATAGAERAAATAADELPLNLREVERQMIERALRVTGGQRTRAAHLLGITDRTLRNKLKLMRPV